MNLGKQITRFIDEESAPTFFEYGLLIIVIALVVVAASATLGTAVSSFFTLPTP